MPAATLPKPLRRTISTLPWPVQLPAPAQAPERRQLRLLLAELHPSLHIAHRRLGDVGVGYRMIVDHELIAVLHGQGDLHLGQQRFRIGPRTLLLLPPFVPHALITGGRPVGDHLAVHVDLAPGLPDRPRALRLRQPYAVQLTGCPPLPPVMELDDHSCSLLAEAITLHHASDQFAPLTASVRIQQLLLHLLERHRERRASTAGDPAIGPVLAHIAAHYDDDIRVADLAALAGLARSRFGERFRAWSGRSPMAFLRRYRIDRACEQLHDNGRCLDTIAQACGYADAFAFSKAFRAEMGLSPSAFRRRIGVPDMPSAD